MEDFKQRMQSAWMQLCWKKELKNKKAVTKYTVCYKCLFHKESCQRMIKLGCFWLQPGESYNENLLEENVLLRISK